MTDDSADKTAGSPPEVIRVVCGAAEPEELAALVAVLAAASNAASNAASARGPVDTASTWAKDGRPPSPVRRPGPRAWRTSGLPH